jgi:hypothetical protein
MRKCYISIIFFICLWFPIPYCHSYDVIFKSWKHIPNQNPWKYILVTFRTKELLISYISSRRSVCTEWRWSISTPSIMYSNSIKPKIWVRLNARVCFPAEARHFSLFHNIQTGPGAHPTSYPMGIGGPFPRGKAAGTWNWQLTSI